MKSHWELFQEYYNKAPAAQRIFVDKNVFNKITEVIAKELSNEQKRDLVFATNLMILGFENIENIKPYINTLLEKITTHEKYIKQLISIFIKTGDYIKFGNSSIPPEKRNSIKKQLSVVQNYLLEDADSICKLFVIAQKYNLEKDEIYKKFAITVGDIILGFYRIQDTVPLLQQELGLDPRTAALLGADVLDFLAPLSDPNWQPPEEFEPIDSEEEDSELGQIPVKLEEVVEQNKIEIQPILPNIPTPATPFDTTRVTPDIAPYVAPVVPPLRTMADDMAHPAEQREGLVGGLNYEPVYTSSQDNLRRPISDTPNYVTPIPPRPPQNQNRPSVEEPPRWGG